MFPIALNLKTVPILLIGEGAAFDKRKMQLKEAGALSVASSQSLAASDLEAAVIVMVVGLSEDASETIAGVVRKAKKLVNVEDVPHLCDYYFTSHITRGDLTIAVSTNGASPTLAKRVKAKIAQIFGNEWIGRTQEIKEFRDALRADGKSMKEVMVASDAFLEAKGWLS